MTKKIETVKAAKAGKKNKSTLEYLRGELRAERMGKLADHTPGPWLALPCCDEDDHTPRHADVIQDPRPLGKLLDDSEPLICRAYYGKTDDERLANARLIAAAPEMLAALEHGAKLASFFEAHPAQNAKDLAAKFFPEMRAAIARAKGEN